MINCTEWEDLPLGCWLVKVDHKTYPYQVAYVSENLQSKKIIVVGGRFSFDMPELCGYANLSESDNLGAQNPILRSEVEPLPLDDRMYKLEDFSLTVNWHELKMQWVG